MGAVMRATPGSSRAGDGRRRRPAVRDRARRGWSLPRRSARARGRAGRRDASSPRSAARHGGVGDEEAAMRAEALLAARVLREGDARREGQRHRGGARVEERRQGPGQVVGGVERALAVAPLEVEHGRVAPVEAARGRRRPSREREPGAVQPPRGLAHERHGALPAQVEVHPVETRGLGREPAVAARNVEAGRRAPAGRRVCGARRRRRCASATAPPAMSSAVTQSRRPSRWTTQRPSSCADHPPPRLAGSRCPRLRRRARARGRVASPGRGGWRPRPDGVGPG